jgi:hypothetical protein
MVKSGPIRRSTAAWELLFCRAGKGWSRIGKGWYGQAARDDFEGPRHQL